MSTTPRPVSLSSRGKGASRPDSVSLRIKKAWCGRLALSPFLAVKMTLRVSLAPRERAVLRGDVALNLLSGQFVSNWKFSCIAASFLLPIAELPESVIGSNSLLLGGILALASNRDSGTVKSP